MNFTNGAYVDGTSYKGVIKAYYGDLVKVFGEPDFGPSGESGDGKVTCQWELEFADGTVATIYDWKEGQTPFGEYDWHIGGKSYDAVNCIFDAIDEHAEKVLDDAGQANW